MKVTLESTARIVEFMIGDAKVPARLWQGATADGIPCHAFITRIVPEISESNPRVDELTAEFERDLQRQATPTAAVEAIQLRMIL